MNTRELNRLTNERHLFFSQINAIIPVISYLLNRLAIAKVECMPQDAIIVNSVNEVLRARTFEEVETIVAKHNEEIIGDLMSNFFSGDDATEKILRDMMRPKEAEDKRDPYDREPGEPGYRDREQDYIDDEGREDRASGHGELGFDDFRDPDTGEDLWPKN